MFYKIKATKIKDKKVIIWWLGGGGGGGGGGEIFGSFTDLSEKNPPKMIE